jgi:hypothetical protein
VPAGISGNISLILMYLAFSKYELQPFWKSVFIMRPFLAAHISEVFYREGM